MSSKQLGLLSLSDVDTDLQKPLPICNNYTQNDLYVKTLSKLDSETTPLFNWCNYTQDDIHDASTLAVTLNLPDNQSLFDKKSNTHIIGHVQRYVILPHEGNTKLDKNKIKDFTTKMIQTFNKYRYDDFESGMNNEIRNDLIGFISQDAKSSLIVLRNIIIEESLNDLILNEILIQIGRINDDELKQERLKLLERFLFHNSITVRDGALIGISYINDKRAIPSLQTAFVCESNEYLKKDILCLMEELDESSERPLSKNN